MGHFMKSPVSNEVFEFVFSRLLKMNLKSVDFYKDWIVHFLESTGFKIDGDADTIYFLDDDGQGNVRRYSLSGSTISLASGYFPNGAIVEVVSTT